MDTGGMAGAWDDGPGLHLAGVAQKGAFERGSSVLAVELDATLAQTGRTFAGNVTDDTGHFTVDVNSMTGTYVQLSANGFYYDEVTNDDSGAPLQLVALAHLRDRSIVNVNVLTELEAPRVAYLVSHGASFDDAKAQAQSEVLAAFDIVLSSSAPSEQLDETGSSDADAALLAVSILVQGYLSVSEVSELLSVVSQDLRADGTLDDEAAGEQLTNAATLVSPALVRYRLENRYAALGLAVSLGNFERYIENFRTVAPYALTSRIKFPDQGTYGANVMGLSGNIAPGDYSLAAQTLAKEPVRFRMTWTGDLGNVSPWFYSDFVNMTPSNFDFSTGVQEFTVTDPGSPSDVHLIFRTPGSARIDVYEGDASAITASRDISWD